MEYTKKKIKLNQKRREKENSEKLEKAELADNRRRPKSAINLRQRQQQQTQIQDRLFEKENERIDKLIKTAEILKSEEMKQCPFKPILRKSRISNKINIKFKK